MDNLFLYTVGLIFLTALLGIYVRRRSRDRCLKDFSDYQVTIEMKDGRVMWGRLIVFPNGLELLYAMPNRNADGHVETSYVIMADHMASIQTVYRYHDELNEENQVARRKEIDRTYHPNLMRRTRRWLRNFLNTFRDAFNQSLGAYLSYAKKDKNASQVIKTQDKQLAKIGGEILGAAANEYEPILERYIGRKVVVEELREVGDEKVWVEHAGILKEYTAKWIEILGCRATEEHTFEFRELDRMRLNRDLDFIVRREETGGKVPVLVVQIENHGTEPVVLRRIEAAGDYVHALDGLVAPEDHASTRLTDLPEAAFVAAPPDNLPKEMALRAATRSGEVLITPDEAPALPDIRLVVEAVRDVDRCIPRAHAVLRHGGEPLSIPKGAEEEGK
jgi:hypothetical protein